VQGRHCHLLDRHCGRVDDSLETLELFEDQALDILAAQLLKHEAADHLCHVCGLVDHPERLASGDHAIQDVSTSSHRRDACRCNLRIVALGEIANQLVQHLERLFLLDHVFDVGVLRRLLLVLQRLCLERVQLELLELLIVDVQLVGAGLASLEESERGEEDEDEDDGSGLSEREAAELLAEDDDDGQGPGLDEIFELGGRGGARGGGACPKGQARREAGEAGEATRRPRGEGGQRGSEASPARATGASSPTPAKSGSRAICGIVALMKDNHPSTAFWAVTLGTAVVLSGLVVVVHMTSPAQRRPVTSRRGPRPVRRGPPYHTPTAAPRSWFAS